MLQTHTIYELYVTDTMLQMCYDRAGICYRHVTIYVTDAMLQTCLSRQAVLRQAVLRVYATGYRPGPAGRRFGVGGGDGRRLERRGVGVLLLGLPHALHGLLHDAHFLLDQALHDALLAV